MKTTEGPMKITEGRMKTTEGPMKTTAYGTHLARYPPKLPMVMGEHCSLLQCVSKVANSKCNVLPQPAALHSTLPFMIWAHKFGDLSPQSEADYPPFLPRPLFPSWPIPFALCSPSFPHLQHWTKRAASDIFSPYWVILVMVQSRDTSLRLIHQNNNLCRARGTPCRRGKRWSQD